MRQRLLSTPTLVVLIGVAALLCASLTGLGVWQLQRRVWKLDLIEQVARNAHAQPIDVPAPGAWQATDLAPMAYRRVRIEGQYLLDHTVRVQALTELGGGHWVMTPLQTPQGTTVLVNRGFVPDGVALPPGHGAGAEAVVGLLRLSEPGGGFLRANDAAAGRWYSRDVAAIAAAQGLGPLVAPFFIDAQAETPPGAMAIAGAADAWPRPGMTVLHFRNHHLGYALTWFALAALVAAAGAFLLHSERQLRRRFQADGRADSRDGQRDLPA